MEEDNEFSEDEHFYASDFEDNLEYVLGVEDILRGACTNHGTTSLSSTIFQDTYFHMSDFESNSGCDEDMAKMFEGDGGLVSNFTTIDFPYFVDESLKPSFHDVLLEPSPKFVQFTLASTNLMVDSLRREKYPTFHEIREADKKICPLFTSHGRPIDINDV